jgi:hypothetical protein
MKKIIFLLFYGLCTFALAEDQATNTAVAVNSTTQDHLAGEPPQAPTTPAVTQNTQVSQTSDQVPAQVNSEAPTPPQPVDARKALLNPEAQSWLDKQADQPYVALVNEYETTIKPDWSYEEHYHARVKIQKEEGKDLSQWPIYYNKARDAITSIQAHVETPDGRQYPAADIKDVPVYDQFPMYSDIRMKILTLPQLTVGSIIEVNVTSTTTSKEIPSQFWGEILYPALPTQRASHTFIVPDDKSIEVKNYKTDYKPLIEKSDGKTKYTFTFNETNPLPDEDELMPPLQEVLGAIYISSINDWKVVANWYLDLVRQNIVDDAQITVKTLELTKEKTTQQDKARAIFEYLQDNFRLVPLNFGDNTVPPHQTSEIFKNRYGDSKDMSLLAKQMLKLAGIDSNVCLFSNEFSGNPQNGLPSPAVFGSVILQTSLDGHSFYVDPMLKGFDLGRYPSNYDNAYVFVIDELGGYKFDSLPVGSEDDHSLVSQADITINLDGSAEYRVHVKLPIETSQSFKKSWTSANAEDKEKFFANLEQNFAKEGKMIDRKVTGIEDRYGPVEFEMKYQAPKAYPIVNDMILIKEEDQSDIPDFVSDSRKNPIFVPNNSLIKNTNIYHLPEGFKINAVPSSYSLSIDMMDVAVNYQQKDNTIQVDSSYRTKRSLIPIERYAQVKDFRKDLSKKNEQYIILKKTSEVSDQAKDWVKKQ